MVQGEGHSEVMTQGSWCRMCVCSVFCVNNVPPDLIRPFFKRIAIVVSIITMVLSCTTAGILAAEMVRANKFYSRSLERMESNNRQDLGPIYDRDGQNISTEHWRHLVSLSYTERGLMTVFMCGEIMLLLACGALIRAAFQGIRQYAIPWLGLVSINAVFGTTVLFLDSVYYSFHTENIAVLTFWIIYQLIMAICLKAVFSYFLKLPNPNPMTGLAIFDPSSPDEAIFVIAGQMESQSRPVSIMLTPPSYLDSISDEDYTKPPSEGGEEIPTEKPPDYEP